MLDKVDDIIILLCFRTDFGKCAQAGGGIRTGSAGGPAPSDPVAAAMVSVHLPAVQKLKRRFGEDARPSTPAPKKKKTLLEFFSPR
jgi:hypothetical protein